ncbi:MAG TPA: hypothetical protein VJ673_11560 [Aromatoleum sp.]|uniref:hypothetical protein n=1 Tax=Aromatoleum sp. TaxID=2307007 RepID=UPI002B4942ED|nr:hypothetical protein [Aromatoleum sp.]HJV26319.1 hypothetical protein [Aromatoleum sp.]
MSLDDVIAKFKVEYGTAGTAPVLADVPAAPLKTPGGTAGTPGTAQMGNWQERATRAWAQHADPGDCAMRTDTPHVYGLAQRPLPEDRGVHKSWRVSVPGRTPFDAVCMQGASAAEIRSQWPGAAVEPNHA